MCNLGQTAGFLVFKKLALKMSTLVLFIAFIKGIWHVLQDSDPVLGAVMTSAATGQLYGTQVAGLSIS